MAASTPPALLRASLAAQRDSGQPFGRAWPVALTAALASAQTSDQREAWTGALEAPAAWTPRVVDADLDIEVRRAVVGGFEAPASAVERASGSSSPT